MALAARDERGLRERYGVAVNASRLEAKSSALELIGDMGYARISMTQAAIGEVERKEAELGPWLWRAIAKDKTAIAVACELFTEILRMRPYFAEIEAVDAGIARRFAECVLEEWMSLRCRKCGGSGWEEISATGKRVRPTGRTRNAPKAICGSCRGSGKPKESPQLRMRVLQRDGRKISEFEYRMLWRRQFVLALVKLKQIATMPRSHLQAVRSSV